MIAPSLLEAHLIPAHRPAGRFRRPRITAAPTRAESAILIRFARAQDRDAVARLEAMEERLLPAGGRLIAEVDGRTVAAASLPDGSIVADPFERSAAVGELLRLRVRQLRAAAA